MQNTNNYASKQDSTEPSSQPKEKQEQSDPQLTELAGFTDSNEDLEPTLTDGTKAPDKAPPENVND
ncbi:MAG TPA: hypothetical protein VEY10_21610 [Flavisolibacter sp.]|jgi:hypothetical protein|nr:hypothetical protein [Flavisolibacter sp.]